MTVICALHVAGVTWMGADSMAGDGTIQPLSVMKWRRNGACAVGWAGDLRTAVLIDRHIEMLEGLDPLQEAAAFSVAIFKTMIAEGFTKDGDKPWGAPAYGNSFMLAMPRGVFYIDPSAALLAAPEGTLMACGSGKTYAYGADHAMRLHGASAEDRVFEAVQASIALDPHCRGPIFCEKL